MDKNGFTPNDNRTVLGMLAGEIGKSNRGRNRILAGAVFLCIVLPQFFLQNSQLLMGAYAVITVCYSAFLLHFAWKYWALCQT